MADPCCTLIVRVYFRKRATKSFLPGATTVLVDYVPCTTSCWHDKAWSCVCSILHQVTVNGYSGHKQMCPDIVAHPDNLQSVLILEPVYRLNKNVSQRKFREAVNRALHALECQLDDLKIHQQLPASANVNLGWDNPQMLREMQWPGEQCVSRTVR